jgi:hypothetical protein
MCRIDGAALKADAVEGSLYDYILLGVDAAAYLMPCPRRYPHLIPEAAQLKAISSARRGAIITGRQ